MQTVNQTTALANLELITSSSYYPCCGGESIKFERTDGTYGAIHAPTPSPFFQQWWGVQKFIDSYGRVWDSCSQRYVVDNFGDLIQVAL